MGILLRNSYTVIVLRVSYCQIIRLLVALYHFVKGTFYMFGNRSVKGFLVSILDDRNLL